MCADRMTLERKSICSTKQNNPKQSFTIVETDSLETRVKLAVLRTYVENQASQAIFPFLVTMIYHIFTYDP